MLNNLYFKGEINHNNENNRETNYFNNYFSINDDNEIIEKNQIDDHLENTNIDKELAKEDKNKIFNEEDNIMKISNEFMPKPRKTVVNFNHAQTSKIEDI